MVLLGAVIHSLGLGSLQHTRKVWPCSRSPCCSVIASIERSPALLVIVIRLLAAIGLAFAALAYGRIFTSWGLAGLAATWIACILYSRPDGYGVALYAAATLALISSFMSPMLAGRQAKI